MFKSLRYRFFTWFVFSTLLVAAFAFLLYQIHSKSEAKNQASINSFQNIRCYFLKDQQLISKFLSTGIYANGFYKKGESEYLSNHYLFVSKIDSCFIELHNSNHSFVVPSHHEPIISLRNALTNYNIVFDSLIYNMQMRGFGNSGLEGKLSQYFQEIESSKQYPFSTLNKIKAYKTAYSLQPDSIYVIQIEDLIQNQLLLTSNPYLKQKVQQYQKTFGQIVEINNRIGLYSHSGLLASLDNEGMQVEKMMNASIQASNKAFQEKSSRLRHFFFLTVFLFISLSFTLNIYASKYLISRFEQLAQYLSSLAKHNFAAKLPFISKHSTVEFKMVVNALESMLAQLNERDKQRATELRKVKDEEQRYRDLANLLPQAVYETDTSGRLIYVNRCWFKTFGYSPNDVERGINIMETIQNPSSDSRSGYLKIENNDMLATRKDGSCFPVTVHSDVIKKGLRVVGKRGVIIDASLKYKQFESLKSETEKAITSDKLKSSFLANMSHEIRTPMNSIIGFSNMLSSREISEEVKESFINHIQSSSEMLLNLVDDIIDVAKIEAGQLKIRKVNCLPKYVIEELTENFEAYKTRVDKTHITLSYQLPDKELPFKTDEFRLKQILTNLISNAIKFTEIGHVEVGLRMKNTQWLEFWVKDTGIGMNQKELRSIFDRFKRTDHSENKNINGTGLGLAISKNLVEMLGGNMYVESSPEKGTRFSFELPYIRVIEPNFNTAEKRKLPIASYQWTGNRILIVEDNLKVYSYLHYLLQETGVETIHATNGREAVKAVDFYSIDIILMDIQLPELDGLETTKLIKEKYPNLPIIAQTAFAMEKDRAICISAGCDDYIAKPIDANALLSKIAQFIAPKPAPKNGENIFSLNNPNDIKENPIIHRKTNNE